METERNMKYLLTILGIFGLDFGVKGHIEKTTKEGSEKKLCGGLLLLRHHHNRGAFLNMGQKRQGVVAAVSVALSIVLTALFAGSLTLAGKGLLKWGLTLMLGGAYSNTYDRLRRRYVVDYVSFPVPFKALGRVIFNISDFCIMIGAMLSVIGYLK